MKFQKLIIHNIASVEDATIDFEASPLKNSDVFLICGETGSGKSTILDAISLALYGNTPRLKNTNIEGSTIENEKGVSVTDTRQLMRKNTGTAFVSLTFTDKTGTPYEAGWYIQRARGKVDGNIQNVSRSLKNLKTDEQFCKKTEIDNIIQNIIGLSFDQFCRTTMLAQGDFTRFLNSPDKEKAAILEKITGTGEYSEIGAKVYQITSEKKYDFDMANNAISNITILADDEITEKTATLEKYEIELKNLVIATEAVITKLQWYKADRELKDQLHEAQKNIDIAKEICESDEIIEAQNLIKQWSETINARNLLQTVHSNEIIIKAQKQRLIELCSQFEKVIGGCSIFSTQIKNIEKEISEISIFLEQNKERKIVYDNIQNVTLNLNNLVQHRLSIKKSMADIAKIEAHIRNKIIPVLESNNKIAIEIEEQIKKDEKDKYDLEIMSEKYDLARLRTQIQDYNNSLLNIKTAIYSINTLETAQKVYLDKKLRLDNLIQKLKTEQSEFEQLSPIVQATEINCKNLKEIKDKLADSVSSWAESIRHKLTIGDHCPICNRIIEEAFDNDEYSRIFQDAEEKYKAAEDEYQLLLKKLNSLQAEININTEQKNRLTSELEQDNTVNSALKNATENCKKCNIDIIDQTTLSALTKSEKETEAALNNIRLTMSEAEKVEKQIKTINNALDSLRNKLNKIIENNTISEKEKISCEQDIKNKHELIEATKLKITEIETNLLKIISPGLWQYDEWNKNPEMFCNMLKTKAEYYHKQENKLIELKYLLKNDSEKLNSILHIVSSIRDLMPEWENTNSATAKEVKELTNLANNLLADIKTSLGIKTEATKNIKDCNKSIEEFITQHSEYTIEQLIKIDALTEDEINKMRERVDMAKRNFAEKSAIKKSIEKKYAEHAENKAGISDSDNEETLNNTKNSLDVARDNTGKEIGAIKKELENDKLQKEKLKSLIADRDTKSAIYNKWNRLNELIGDATGSKFRKIAQSFILSNLINAANHYMRSLTDRYILKVTPGGFVISVEDAYQGYATRAVTTISGGESFLVSLSLALALSDIGNKISFDTLFIDEGFGTLSGEPLQNAISTLRTLHSTSGRHVGIISHIEELKEQIPIQIQVNREGNSSSSNINIIEQ